MKKNKITILLTLIIVILISIITLMYFGIIKTNEKDCELNNDSNNNQVKENNNSKINNNSSNKSDEETIVTIKGDKYIPTYNLLDLIGIKETGLKGEYSPYYLYPFEETNGDEIINNLSNDKIDFLMLKYATSHNMTVEIVGEKIEGDYCKAGNGRCTVTNEGVYNFIAQKYDIKKTSNEIYGSNKRYKDYLILYETSGSVSGPVKSEESIVFEYIGDEILATYKIKTESNEVDILNTNSTIKFYFKRINQDYFDNNEWALYKYNRVDN